MRIPVVRDRGERDMISGAAISNPKAMSGIPVSCQYKR